MTFGKGCHLHLIDGSAYIFRAYHALPPLTRKSDGMPVGAVAGFCNLLWGELTHTRKEAPTHLAVIFDAGSKTFRNDIYPAYKANRPDLPEDLRFARAGQHFVIFVEDAEHRVAVQDQARAAGISVLNDRRFAKREAALNAEYGIRVDE